ncbi:MAG: ribonuclease R [Eubacteriales bacterium]
MKKKSTKTSGHAKSKNYGSFYKSSVRNSTSSENNRPKRTLQDRRNTEPVSVSENVPRGPLALKNQCVGILRESGFDGYVEPDVGYDSTQYGKITVYARDLNGAPFGMKVVCEIKNPQAAGGAYEGRIIEVLGDPGRSDVAILSIVRQYGLSPVFPEAVLEEAEKYPVSPSEEEIAGAISSGRRDLRDLRTITMDGEDAKDLDDAISIEKLTGKGYKLYVHIADVSNYVKEGSALDDEARLRATSVYLVDRVIPMLPPRLSNGLCSLNPNTPRFALTASMTVNYEGEVTQGDLFESVIKSDARTSYKEVYGVLFEQKYLDRYADFIPMFDTMKELTEILSAKRAKRGALDFTFPETHVDLDEEGKPLSIYAYPILYTNKMIEEFMILCNEFVAARFFDMKYPFVYRVHEDPDPLKIAEFLHVARLFGAKASVHGKPTPFALSSLMKQIEGEPFTPALSQILLRSLAKARYSEENLGHFGLASDGYCHFTSPIRRYPDLYIHRIIKSFLHDEGKKSYFASQVADVSEHSSVMERNSMDAERATVSQKVAEYMMEHTGSTFDGIISSIFRGGIFVQLESTVEGLIPFRTMNDYFEFDERRLEARGKTSGKVYKIGEKIQVKVANVDPVLRRVDFVLIDPADGGRRRPKERKETKKDAGKDIRSGDEKSGAAARGKTNKSHNRKKGN